MSIMMVQDIARTTGIASESGYGGRASHSRPADAISGIENVRNIAERKKGTNQ
jgi:hypothetical protein